MGELQGLDPSGSLMYMQGSYGLHMPYSHFSSGDAPWTLDPSVIGGPWAPSVMGTQPLQSPFFYPGAADIWGQEALTNPLLMTNPYMNLAGHVAMDQSGSAIGLDGSVDPMTVLGQGFSGMAVNGTVPGVPLAQPTVVATTPSTPGGVETVPPQDSSTASNPPAESAPPVQQQSSAPQPEKPKSWAAIAGQPAKPRPPPPKPQPPPAPTNGQASDGPRKSGSGQRPGGLNPASTKATGGGQSSSMGRGTRRTNPTHPHSSASNVAPVAKNKAPPQSELVDKLQAEHKYNPCDMPSLIGARFFVIKSYAEDDIHRSIKYSIWTSTEHGNRRLDQAYKEQKGKGVVFLFFSVNGSGHFCGLAQMASEVDFQTTTGVWVQDKWKGRLDVKWIYVKDVPNSQLRHIRLENNENKPVTNSRDTQEVPPDKGKQVVKIMHNYQHTTSIFDDFDHYERKQEEDSSKKVGVAPRCSPLGLFN